MAELHFGAGALKSPKSQLLMTSAFDCGKCGQRAVLIKPQTGLKGGDMLVSRAGMSRRVDLAPSIEEAGRSAAVGPRPCSTSASSTGSSSWTAPRSRWRA